jgi:TolB-like protein/class 3 adenylate cyclase/tetratricopeptide (TPR) repeat protein
MLHHRQLSAILFTDIEGYTSIMQQDEDRAIGLKDRHREILQKEHKRFNGSIVQYYGDGTLSTFASVVEAVHCALAMQQQFLQPPHVPVRMGLHMGDILVSDESIFGDGVNVASRIESLAVAGSILISDKANNELYNHPQFKTTTVGTYQFKNVSRAIEVFALDHQGLVIPAAGSLKGKTEPIKTGLQNTASGNGEAAIKSIAVLPFVNMSNDPDQDYFGDGIAEEIINSLTHLKDLKVAGRTSSFKFKGKNVDLRKLKEKLGVNTVLEGSVRKQGNAVRVTAQLIKVEDGFHLWSERFDRDMGDIFAIQDEISLAITEKLKVTLLHTDREKIVKPYTQSTKAYELYLKGRFQINKRGVSIHNGIQCFKEAIDTDPEYALPYAGFADALSLAASWGLVHPGEVMRKVKSLAQKALELESELCEPYCSLGFYFTFFEWNWKEAKKYFLKSIELNPNYPLAHYWYGWDYLCWVEGNFEEAQKHGELAIRLDPLSSVCYGCHSLILHAGKKYDEGLAYAKMGLELDPGSFICHLSEGNCYTALKQYEEAIKSFESALRLSNRNPFPLNALIWTCCLNGAIDTAQSLFLEVKEKSKEQYVSSTLTGISAAYLGNLDEAFNYFSDAMSMREPILLSLKHQAWIPEFLKADPRYGRLLKSIGFPGS